MEYVHEEQYYDDLYDLATIKECLNENELFFNVIHQEHTDKAKNPVQHVSNFITYFVKGNRWEHKKETIEKWIEADKKKRATLDNAIEPSNVKCSDCGGPMHSSMRTLDDFTNNTPRVLFFMKCGLCNKQKGVYENGEIRISKSGPCPECTGVTKTSFMRTGNVITTTRMCNICSFNEVDIEDLDKSDEEWKEKLENDKQLLEKYRSEFCMSDKDGQEYVQGIANIKAFTEMQKSRETKEADPAYQKAKSLRRLSVVELEKLLLEVTEKEKYAKFTLDKPEIAKFVIVPFSVQETDPSRSEYDSTNNLKKIIVKSLENTNWRLMSEGIGYRLGFLSGRLKGYEREEDLMNLFK